MTNHATMGKVPIEIKINGETFKASPLTLRDLGHIEQWARSRIVAAARQVISEADDSLKYDDKVLMLDRAYKTCATISFLSEGDNDEMSALFTSIDGMCQIMWASMRRDHPDLTPDSIGDMITVENLSDLVSQIMLSSGFVDDDDDKDKDKDKGGDSPEGETKSV